MPRKANTEPRTPPPQLVGAPHEGRARAVIDAVLRHVDAGRFAVKCVAGEPFEVTAHVFTDGHDAVRARLVLQSVVTGQTGIDLDLKPGTPARLLARGRSRVPEIPAARDRLDALLEQLTTLPLNDLLGDVRRTMASLNEALRTTQAGVDRASDQLVRTAQQAERTLAVGADALQAVQKQTRSTLAAVETLSHTSDQVLKQTAPELQHSLRSAREAADAARTAMGQVAELSAPGAPVRADLEGAMRDLALSARNLRALSERLERQPNALLFGGDREP